MLMEYNHTLLLRVGYFMSEKSFENIEGLHQSIHFLPFIAIINNNICPNVFAPLRELLYIVLHSMVVETLN